MSFRPLGAPLVISLIFICNHLRLANAVKLSYAVAAEERGSTSHFTKYRDVRESERMNENKCVEVENRETIHCDK